MYKLYNENEIKKLKSNISNLEKDIERLKDESFRLRMDNHELNDTCRKKQSTLNDLLKNFQDSEIDIESLDIISIEWIESANKALFTYLLNNKMKELYIITTPEQYQNYIQRFRSKLGLYSATSEN